MNAHSGQRQPGNFDEILLVKAYVVKKKVVDGEISLRI